MSGSESDLCQRGAKSGCAPEITALVADRRATWSIRIASTEPSPLLGTAVACPLRTARAAACASGESVLPNRRRSWRLGRFTSTTSRPMLVRWRARRLLIYSGWWGS